MAINKQSVPGIDNSDPVNYPNGRIKDNSGAGDGTPVNRTVYSDLHEVFAKLMRLADIAYSGLPDNESTGYQLVDALVALAGKNDLITPINSLDGIIVIGLKLNILKTNEIIICRSTFDYSGETQIKGIGGILKGITVLSNFKSGDYIRLINNDAGITFVRLADAGNIDTIVSEAKYLKAATELEEYTGASLTKATTPYTNQLAFARRIIGLDSNLFLASLTRNGLMSAADKAIISGLVNPVKNVGWFSGVDPGGEYVGTLKPRSGDVLSAQVLINNGVGESVYLITFKNDMVGQNYFVRIHVQSEGNITADDDTKNPVFKIVNNTQIQIAIQEAEAALFSSLKIHLEAVQL